MKKGKSGNMKKVLACVVAGMMIFQTGCSNAGNKGEPAESSVDSEENVLPFVPGGKANIDSIRD
jgi:hypothetical protein